MLWLSSRSIKDSTHCPGMVELVPSSDTLRKIQVEYGVTGSFKDKPLAEWLRKYNPAEDEYEKVHERWMRSGFLYNNLNFWILVQICNFIKLCFCSFTASQLELVSSSFFHRHQRTSSTHVQDAVSPPTSWASVIVTTTTSCCAPLVTCSTLTLASSWAMPRCLAALKGKNNVLFFQQIVSQTYD